METMLRTTPRPVLQTEAAGQITTLEARIAAAEAALDNCRQLLDQSRGACPGHEHASLDKFQSDLENPCGGGFLHYLTGLVGWENTGTTADGTVSPWSYVARLQLYFHHLESTLLAYQWKLQRSAGALTPVRVG